MTDNSLTVEIIKRIKMLFLPKEKDRSFAIRCGIPQTTFSGYVGGKRAISLENLKLISEANSISLDWLITGEGPMRKGEVNVMLATHESGPESDEISEVEALEMTRNVIRSETVYRSALLSNIRAFNQAVINEGKMKNTDEKIDQMIGMMSEIQEQNRILAERLGYFEDEKKRAGNAH